MLERVSNSAEPDRPKATLDERWNLAETRLGTNISVSNISVWRLERVKAAAERISYSKVLTSDLKKPSPLKFLTAILRIIAFVCTALAAIALFIIYLVIFRKSFKSANIPSDTARLVAVHGEWSSRTKHVLNAISDSDPKVSAILVLGRQNQPPEEIAKMWLEHVPSLNGIPVLVPVTLSAAFAALRDFPGLLKDGLVEVVQADKLLGAWEEMALAFRVLLGATQARWWQQQTNIGTPDVVFGSTGTADTTLLENGIQKTGCSTIHIVHGQSTGPNFVGLSDHALFKSKHDASQYIRLKCYKNCTFQPADPHELRRGEKGILLLSNLAHPMNHGFRTKGISDEINLLECVSRAARLLYLPNTVLSWKPHPVINTLDPEVVAQLRKTAKSLGFNEMASETSMADASETARWTICSPSTVATDLLELGTLSLVLDPQNSLGSSAISVLPSLTTLQPEALAALMAEIDKPGVQETTLHKVYSLIEPARPLDLSIPLH